MFCLVWNQLRQNFLSVGIPCLILLSFRLYYVAWLLIVYRLNFYFLIFFLSSDGVPVLVIRS